MADAPVQETSVQEPAAKSAIPVRAPAPSPPAGDGAGAGVPARAPEAGWHFLQPRWRTRRIVSITVAAVLLILIAAGVRYYRLNAGFVRTDNAQTAGDVAPVSARITGTVSRVAVSENDFVKAGAVLVELDPTDYRLALEHARAQLAAARAQTEATRMAVAAQGEQFRAAVANAEAGLQLAAPHLSQAEAQLRMSGQTSPAQIAQARAQVTTAQANVQAAKSDLDTAARNLGRDRTLLSQGAISAQQLDTDTATYESARARYQASQDALRQARDGLLAAQASHEQVTIARHDVEAKRGEVSQARAQLQQAATGQTLVQQRARELAVAEAQAGDAASALEMAQVNLSRTKILAPEDGWVTNRTVQIGQVVQPNQPLLSLTLAHHFWVVANIKETQVGGIRVGQPVRITVDAIRRHVFRGHVESIGKTTGSTTALLPPDNATGNFIKVVQLVPVRIALDPDQRDPPLQLGLSCEVAIDTRQAHP